MDIAQLGASVKRLRRAAHLTQVQLAQAAGLSRATIAALETGTLAEIGFVKAQRILESLGSEFKIIQAPAFRPTMDELMAMNEEDSDANQPQPRYRS